MIAHRSGINWNWFIEYEPAGPGKIRVLRHYRIHHGSKMPEGAFKHEYDLLEKHQDKYGNLPPGYKIGDQRIANRLVIDHDYDNPLKVVNPKYVFGYPRQ